MFKVRWLQAMLALLTAVVFIGCGGGGGGGVGSTGTNATTGSTSTTATTGSTGTVSVAVTPSDATAVVGGQRTFTATVTGNANTAVSWSVVGSGAGTISPSGVYTAPNTPGTYSIKATSVADSSKSATVQVVVGTAAFIHIGDLPGGIFSSGVQGLNADGSVVVGFATPTPPSGSAAANNAAKWTEAGGLFALSGVGPGTAFATSADGSVVVGIHQITSLVAFRWSAGGGVEDLPRLSGATGATTASDVSANGSVIVGQGFNSSSQQRGLKWVGSNVTSLDPIAGGTFSFATAVSGDGNVVVGESGITIGARAVRWVGNNPASSIGVLSGGSQSLAHDVNTDGTVIVGESGTTTGGTHTSAFRWTQVGGMVALGSLPGASMNSRAYAVSGDGNTIVGESQTGTTAQDTRAFIWTQGGGMQELQTVLANRGMAGPLTGWVLLRATTISTDGRVIGGIGTNPSGLPEGWIAILP